MTTTLQLLPAERILGQKLCEKKSLRSLRPFPWMETPEIVIGVRPEFVSVTSFKPNEPSSTFPKFTLAGLIVRFDAAAAFTV